MPHARPARPASVHQAVRTMILTGLTAVLAVAGVNLTALSASAAGSLGALTVAQATPVGAYPTDIVPVDGWSTRRADTGGLPGGTGVQAATDAVRSACAGGAALAAAQWYLLAPREVAAAVQVVERPADHGVVEQVPAHYAVVSTDPVAVLGCGTDPVTLPADSPALLVAYFDQAVTCLESAPTACDEPVSLATLNAVRASAAPNDDWQDAELVAGSGFTGEVDTSRAAADGPDGRQAACDLSAVDPMQAGNVWYRFTATTSGPLTLRASSPVPGYRPYIRLFAGSASGPEAPEQFEDDSLCDATPTVEAGQDYYVAIGAEYDPYFAESRPVGGLVRFQIGAADAAPSSLRNVSAVLDASAASATLSWFPPQSLNGTTITGYQVTRTVVDSQGNTLFTWSGTLPSSSRSTVLTHLDGWAVNRLSVRPLLAEGTVAATTIRTWPTSSRPSAPRAVTGTQAEGKVTVAWKPPASSGRSTVTGYRVRQFSATGTVAQRTWTLGASARSLTAATAPGDYRYDVTAISAAGNGRPSEKTAVVEVPDLFG